MIISFIMFDSRSFGRKPEWIRRMSFSFNSWNHEVWSGSRAKLQQSIPAMDGSHGQKFILNSWNRALNSWNRRLEKAGYPLRASPYWFTTFPTTGPNGRVQSHFEPSSAGVDNLHAAPSTWHVVPVESGKKRSQKCCRSVSTPTKPTPGWNVTFGK
jgi:hypothetical protein